MTPALSEVRARGRLGGIEGIGGEHDPVDEARRRAAEDFCAHVGLPEGSSCPNTGWTEGIDPKLRTTQFVSTAANFEKDTRVSAIDRESVSLCDIVIATDRNKIISVERRNNKFYVILNLGPKF